MREVFDLAAHADLMVVGIGSAKPDAQLVASQMIESDEIREVNEMGGQGELLGHFFDGDGNPVQTSLASRTVAPALADLAGRRIVAIAGGEEKLDAIRAVLKSRLLGGLVTDETTALALCNERVDRKRLNGEAA